MNSSAPETASRKPGTPEGIRALIIGYGNELRRDDGAGPTVARIIRERRIPGVSVETCHQLLPEHAAKLATVELVIFVDATQEGADDIGAHRIHPATRPEFCGHRCDPEKLLYWCDQLVSRVPHAWFVHIPGSDFGIGEGLSFSTDWHVQAAVSSILGIMQDHAGNRHSMNSNDNGSNAGSSGLALSGS